MKQFFVLGVALLALALSGCATRSYARRQAATVSDRLSQVQKENQTQFAALSDKHQTDVARIDERITASDKQVQQAVATATQANINAVQANANAAQANASIAQASASAAQASASAAGAQATAAQAEAAAAAARAEAAAAAARADALAAQERAVIAQNTPPAAPTSSGTKANRSELPTTLPQTGSPFPLIGLGGLLSLGVGGTLRLLGRR